MVPRRGLMSGWGGEGLPSVLVFCVCVAFNPVFVVRVVGIGNCALKCCLVERVSAFGVFRIKGLSW